MADRALIPTDLAKPDRNEERDEPASGLSADPQPAAAAPEGSGSDASLPTHVPRSVRNLLWQARIGVGLALLFAALAIFFFVQASDLRDDAAARAEVLEAGRTIAQQITTYEGATIDQWVVDTQELATPSFAEEVATLFDPELRVGMAENELRSAGALTSSFVQEVDGEDATVFAVLRQTYSSINLPREVSDELRMEVGLQRVDGRWLAAEVVVLGPSTITPVPGVSNGGTAPADSAAPSDGAAPPDEEAEGP